MCRKFLECWYAIFQKHKQFQSCNHEREKITRILLHDFIQSQVNKAKTRIFAKMTYVILFSAGNERTERIFSLK